MSHAHAIETTTQNLTGEIPMIVFSQERKAAITAMKNFIKGHRHSVSHHHYVLYSALRGQDIRKTSHLPDGENALDRLSNLKSRLKYHEKSTNFFFRHIVDAENEMIFKSEDIKWLNEVLEEALTITTLTPEANDGVNTLAASQRR